MASFHRSVKCQICGYLEDRGSPCLAKSCPKCGSRMKYATHWKGDQPVTPDPRLKRKVVGRA